MTKRKEDVDGPLVVRIDLLDFMTRGVFALAFGLLGIAGLIYFAVITW